MGRFGLCFISYESNESNKKKLAKKETVKHVKSQPKCFVRKFDCYCNIIIFMIIVNTLIILNF